jgi:Tol biopolymer transport system component
MVACFYRDGPEGSPAKIAVLPIGGGKVRTIVEAPPTAIQSLGIRWTPDGQSLMYVDNRAGVSNVWRQPINGGAAVQLTNFKSDQIFSFDWSGDGKLTCSRGVETSDVVLIRDFKESMAALK